MSTDPKPTPAKVEERHLNLAGILDMRCRSILAMAQLLADSEAQAVEEVTRASGHRNQLLQDAMNRMAERNDALRAALASRDALIEKLRPELEKCFWHFGREIKRMSLLESANTGTQTMSKEVAVILDAVKPLALTPETASADKKT